MKSSSCEAGIWYLLEDANHGCGRADVQSEWRGQHILVLQAAGVKLGPELHLQQTVVLLTELVLGHAALKLKTMFSGNTDEEMHKGGKQHHLTSFSTVTVTSFFSSSHDKSEYRSVPRL